MKAGDRRHKLTFEQKIDVSDGMGGYTATLSAYHTCYGAIWQVRGSEAFDAMKLEGRIVRKIRILYKAGITAAMRIKWHRPQGNGGTTYFKIIAPPMNHDERNKDLDILAEEDI